MILIELSGKADQPAFGPTEKFTHIYGNYGGPGNRGGEPIDGIDAACKKHDMCYHYQGRDNPACDLALIQDLDDQLKTRLSFKQRVAAQMMRLFFRKKLSKHKND